MLYALSYALHCLTGFFSSFCDFIGRHCTLSLPGWFLDRAIMDLCEYERVRFVLSMIQLGNVINGPGPQDDDEDDDFAYEDAVPEGNEDEDEDGDDFGMDVGMGDVSSDDEAEQSSEDEDEAEARRPRPKKVPKKR